MAFTRPLGSQLGEESGFGVQFRGLKKEEDEESEIDEAELDEIEETIAERLIGLTEMVPDRVWDITSHSLSFSYWLVRRSAWVLGTSLAILLLPVFVEQQRLELLEMQDMHTKQVMLGQGAPPTGRRMLPPGPPPK